MSDQGAQITKLAEVLWSYHLLDHKLEKADVLIGFGSNDLNVARRIAKLYLNGYAPHVLFSGNSGALENAERIANRKGLSEAEWFKKEAVKMGVPASKILVEPNSTNSGENILFSQKNLTQNKIKADKIIVTHKPYMERRVYAALMAQWPAEPKPDFIITSQQISFTKYIAQAKEFYPKDYVINALVGTVQRIIEYPKKEFQAPQEVPPNVFNAYQKLIELGFDEHFMV